MIPRSKNILIHTNEKLHSSIEQEAKEKIVIGNGSRVSRTDVKEEEKNGV